MRYGGSCLIEFRARSHASPGIFAVKCYYTHVIARCFLDAGLKTHKNQFRPGLPPGPH